MRAGLSIGDLSRATGVKPTTIRFYEGEGLLPRPARTGGGHRDYVEDHLRRLGFIRHARELGFSTDAIRALLALASDGAAACEQVHALATEQVAEIDHRIRRLEALRAELVRMAEGCVGGTVADCRILETLADFGHGHCADPNHGALPAGPGG